ncbi:MAG: hypothetical protein ACKOGA_22760, partial [Planctomycetaceae bacterium]
MAAWIRLKGDHRHGAQRAPKAPASLWRVVRWWWFLLLAAGSCSSVCQDGWAAEGTVLAAQAVGEQPPGRAPVAKDRAEAAAREHFRTRVVPLLISRCLGCHHEQRPAGGLSLVDSRQ